MLVVRSCLIKHVKNSSDSSTVRVETARSMRFLLITAMIMMAAEQLHAQPLGGAVQHQWRNQSPDQQRALNQFYQSITPTTPAPGASQRQEHAQQLRNMSPQQRQQFFLNYIQQKRR